MRRARNESPREHEVAARVVVQFDVGAALSVSRRSAWPSRRRGITATTSNCSTTAAREIFPATVIPRYNCIMSRI